MRILLKYISAVILMSCIWAFIKIIFIKENVEIIAVQRITIILIISLIGTIGYWTKDND